MPNLRLSRRRRRAPPLDHGGAGSSPKPTRPRSRSTGSSTPASSTPSTSADPLAPEPAGLREARARQRRRRTRALVRYDAATGRREVWVPAARLSPPAIRSRSRRGLHGLARPEAAAAVHQLPESLAAEHPRRLLGARSRHLEAPEARRRQARRRRPSCSPSSRPTADGSPTCGSTTSTSSAWPTAAITQLTRDGSRTIINGTFDWVYEEELNLRDGFRWSPDGRRIAFWQLDASGVNDFDLINDTDSLYSFVVPVQYPKAGTTNSAARVGVVSADGGEPPSGSMSPATRATTTSRGSSGRPARTRSCSST